MPFPFRNAFSSPSSSSSSPSDSPLKENTKGSKFFKNFGRSLESKPRLTRQRKLRHPSDAELGLQPSNDRSQSLPVSPTAESRSPRHVSRWSTSVVPQPLPLPELNSVVKQQHDHRLLGSNFPSPRREGQSRGDGNGIRDGAREGNTSNSAMSSNLSHQSIRMTVDHVVSRSSRFPTYRRRGFPRDLSVENVHHNFRLNIPARSAPTSGFSSPALSPQRFRSVDLFHSPFVVLQEFQVSPPIAGSSSQVLPTRITPSPDHSPLHSPTLQSPCQNTRNPASILLHSHHKSLPESSMAWPEGNNTNVHPLPLPPGVSRPLQPSIVHNSMDKLDASSMKGQWQKGKLIGRGTYGSVYVATNRINGASCAMKEVDLLPDDTKSAECIMQLEQEIKILRQLKHPNIVQYYGSEIVDDRFCIYLEYVHPGSINKFVSEHCGSMTECVVRNFTRHILSGLDYLHATKTIHRDIKGANLLVDASGVVKLADFGLAKHLTGHAVDFSLKGSPHWMAPEVLQAVMRKDANPDHAFAVDIWSVGCTVIEMLTGKPPWSDFNGVQAMFNVLHRSPPIPETLSLEGKDFLRCCFQRNPADRPSAVKLLEHSFLQNLQDQNVSLCQQEFSGMKLLDASHSPRDWNKKDSTSLLPGKLPHKGETCPPAYPETSDTGATSRHSSRSTLEVLPSVSSPKLNCSSQSHNINPSNVSNSFHLGPGNNHHVFSRTHGREIPHL